MDCIITLKILFKILGTLKNTGDIEKCFSGDKEPKARTVHDIKAKFSSPLLRTETNHTLQKYKISNMIADV